MTDDHDGRGSDEGASSGSESRVATESLGLSIPDDHVGAFVAEVFEDPERSTTWATAVDLMIDDGARDAWERLTPTERAIEMLRMATDYDERAIDTLEAIPISGETAPGDVRDRFDEATRCRRNADMLRNAIADAYATGILDDAALVTAVDENGFDTTRVARREGLLESVAEGYEFEFRPYGGTLVHESDDADATSTETW
jgi:hypothetical protein